MEEIKKLIFLLNTILLFLFFTHVNAAIGAPHKIEDFVGGRGIEQSEKIKRPSTKHDVYFKGTDYELHVYKIYGRKDGNTMLIVGGIQGDEPGGFLSADLYVDLKLDRGNLIVLPRANLKSIINNNRGIDGDMNRLFHKDKIEHEMDGVVSVIKGLMAEADVFIHLHDGWGFHAPTYLSKGRNPKMFGQSIIVDTDLYKCDNGKTIDLKSLAYKAIEDINSRIENNKHFMHYFNTETTNKSTKFPGMKKAATFYALKQHCIPAFGVETSKNIPSIEMKILYHNYAINAFMKLFDIEPMHPPIFLIKPEFKYAIIEVNGDPRYVIKGESLSINSGDRVEITHIESNYSRGISCDIIGYGSFNDYHRSVVVLTNTLIAIKKDHEKIFEIPIKVIDSPKIKDYTFFVELNGSSKQVKNNETLKVRIGDRLKIKSFAGKSGFSDIPINVKGFYPQNVNYNTGDDRGFDIVISQNFMKKYSTDGSGRIYPVIAGDEKSPEGIFYLEITE